MQENLIKFNCQSIQEFYSDGNFDKSFFDVILKTKGLPNIVYKDCIGLPWGEWDRVAKLVETISMQKGFLDGFVFDAEEHQAYNFLFFFPAIAVKRMDDLWKEILCLNVNDFNVLLSNDYLASHMVSLVISNMENLMSSNFPQEKLLNLLFVSQKNKFLTSSEEIRLIEYVCKHVSLDKSVQKILICRKESLSKKVSNSLLKNEKDALRYALIVSGQFREPNRNIDLLIHRLQELGALNLKVFVASWVDVGGYNLSSPDKLIRFLSPTVLKSIKEQKVSINEIMDKLRDVYVPISKSDLISKSNFKGSMEIVLNDERYYPYNTMSSAEKMYFNNSLWIETLGKGYFKENFDVIIKVRPDIEIQQLDIHECLSNTVYAEEGWIFRRWGFGMGDQILIGTADSMCELLTCHNREDIYNVVRVLYNSQEKYRGHVNLGITAWSLGFDVEKIKNLKHFFKKPPVINEKFLESITGQ